MGRAEQRAITADSKASTAISTLVRNQIITRSDSMRNMREILKERLLPTELRRTTMELILVDKSRLMGPMLKTSTSRLLKGKTQPTITGAHYKATNNYTTAFLNRKCKRRQCHNFQHQQCPNLQTQL